LGAPTTTYPKEDLELLTVGPDGGPTGTNAPHAYHDAGFTEIHVDIRSLSDFADALRRELNETC
jgi:hypothetical protein